MRIDQRHISFNDQVNSEIIETFFGQSVGHYANTGIQAEIDIREYLESHFKLGSGAATPRIMLMFVQRCLEATIDMYPKE